MIVEGETSFNSSYSVAMGPLRHGEHSRLARARGVGKVGGPLLTREARTVLPRDDELRALAKLAIHHAVLLEERGRKNAPSQVAFSGGDGGTRSPKHPPQSAHFLAAASDCRTIRSRTHKSPSLVRFRANRTLSRHRRMTEAEARFSATNIPASVKWLTYGHYGVWQYAFRAISS